MRNAVKQIGSARPRCTAARIMLLAVVLASAAPACARFRRTPAAGLTPPAPAASAGRMAYAVELTGVGDAKLQALLERSSQLRALQANPPISSAGLQRRVHDDVERFHTVLRSEGYYAADITATVDDSAAPIAIIVAFELGPQYTLGPLRVEYEGDHPVPELPLDPEALKWRIGEPARARTVVDAEAQQLERLARAARPWAMVRHREVIVDHALQAVQVVLHIDPGPVVRYGPTTIAGTTDVDPAFLLRLVPWEEGALYDADAVEEYRHRLRDTRLFAGFTVTLDEAPGAGGHWPVRVRVDERDRHTISAGVHYSSSDGAGADTSWERRNLFGEGELVRVTGVFSELRQGVEVEFRKPHFRRFAQTLILETGFVRQDSDAFEERTVPISAALERRLNDYWDASGGVTVEFTRTDDNEGTRRFVLVGTPFRIMRDTSDDTLNPTTGSRIRLDLTPYGGGDDEDLSFFVTELNASAYVSLREDKRAILAGRVRGGSIVGEPTRVLPAPKRFYSGGGGSVRGYEFQTVGPLDAAEDPLGGRSVAEVGLELRLRLTERIGVVPFVEGGNVYDDTLPDFGEEPLWAGGIGGRYYSAIGPLRLDVAFPLNGRDGVDDDFEFYVSLGQAF